MEDFLKAHPLDLPPVAVDVEQFNSKCRNALGPDILDFYRQYGLASFGGGLLQSLHPVESRELLAGWKMPPGDAYPILKSSFGTIYFKRNASMGFIDPVYQDREDKIGSLDLLLDFFLTDPQFLENSLFQDIHVQVYPRLGLLANDEIYAFVPALGLGGARSADHVEKAKMKEQLLFLSQL